MQQALQYQKITEEIDDSEFEDSMKISNKVHQALYNFSDSRLLELTSNEEFRDIVLIHSEVWRDEGMDSCDRYFYNKIVNLFKQ